MADNLYISDLAYEHLVNMAVQGGFVKPNAHRKSGLSQFLNKLSYSEFEDTRPEDVRQRHREELAREFIPKYCILGEPKISRYLTLDDETYFNYVHIALEHGIHIVGIPLTNRRYRTPLQIVSNTLEAIGVQFITPKLIPVRTMTDKRLATAILQTRTKPKSELTPDNPYYYYFKRGK